MCEVLKKYNKEKSYMMCKVMGGSSWRGGLAFTEAGLSQQNNLLLKLINLLKRIRIPATGVWVRVVSKRL